MASAFVDSACRRGERCVYFAYEESPDQIMRNMASVGYNLARWERKGLLRFRASRSTLYGLEQHLVSIYREVNEVHPTVAVFDPITTMRPIGDEMAIQAMLTRVVDTLKTKGVSALFTSLTHEGIDGQSEAGISSLMDSWILLRNVESGGERNRLLFILKSRGTAHSNQVREFVLTNRGIRLMDVYVGQGEVLAGSARMVQEAKDRAREVLDRDKVAQRYREIEHAQRRLEAQRNDLMIQSSRLDEERERLKNVERKRAEMSATDRVHVGRLRRAGQ
jgi:circadian clock protein KaiC